MFLSTIHKIILLVGAALSGFCESYAQNHLIDSMESDLRHPKNDTFRITLLYNLATEDFGYDTGKAEKYLEEGHLLAQKMNFEFQIANYYETKAKLSIAVNRNDALSLLDSAIRLYEKNISLNHSPGDVSQSKLSIVTCKSQKALVFAGQGKYKEAVSSYLDAIDGWKTSDEVGKNEAVANLYGSISSVYFELKNPQKALEYDKAAIPFRLLDNHDELSALTYLYVSDDFLMLSQIDSAAYYVQLAKPLVEKIKKNKLHYNYLSRIANIYKEKKDYTSAVNYFLKALDAAKKSDDQFIICHCYRALAECDIEIQDFAAARTYLLKALSITDANAYTKEKLEVLKDFVKTEDKSNHPAQAYSYLKQVNVISDSIKLAESNAAIAEIENKYQSTEKEKEIIRLQKDGQIQSLSLKQKSTLNYILIGSLAGVLLLGILLYRNYTQQQMLQQKKISELEKDKQLMAVDAMLKGQEDERSRLAKDLHDGLGGMLSGIKFSLNNMKDNLIVTPDNMAMFERSLDMIDTSIKELRRVAHNMMPEMLVKFGLDEALKEYCNSVTATGMVTAKYQSFGLVQRLAGSTEIIIYRIIQELVNNVLKHATATEVLVQIISEAQRLNILVEDNGRGFDTSILEHTKGAGWTNIRSRVDYLKGRLDVHSELNKGTSVTIEFNI